MWIWELSLCSVVGLIAAAALFGRLQGPRFIALVLLAATFTAGPTAWLFRVSAKSAPLEQFGPRKTRDDDFITSRTCRSCHPNQHDSWHRSFHRTMTQRAHPQAVVPDWSGEWTLEGFRYALIKRGDQFWVRTPDPDLDFRARNAGRVPRAADLPAVERRIVMTTGSHHMQMFWMQSAELEREVRLFPWVYQIRERRWLPYEESFVVSPDTTRPAVLWNENCIACHTLEGVPGYSKSFDRFDSEVSELGISCEACHGPGRKHVKYFSNPLTRYQSRQGSDPHIINPAKLPPKQQTQICGQCHSTFSFRDHFGRTDGPRMLDFYRTGFRYRAGADLEATRHLTHFKPNAPNESTYYWNDGTSRIGGREYLGLFESACYQRGEMTCLSCHSMHDADPDDQLRADRSGDQGCLQCHQDLAMDVPAHTRHAAGSSGSACYSCHMPHSSYALLGAIRSHRIVSPTATGATARSKPNACNLCHQDRTLRWTADYLKKWWNVDSRSLPESANEVSIFVRWLLSGDAAQRVIAASNVARKEAREVSGESWQPPLLAQLLTDEYAAVRFVAFHSLTRFRGFDDLDFEQLRQPESRRLLRDKVIARWQAQRRQAKGRRVLQLPTGEIDRARVKQLLEKRDRTPVQLIE